MLKEYKNRYVLNIHSAHNDSFDQTKSERHFNINLWTNIEIMNYYK